MCSHGIGNILYVDLASGEFDTISAVPIFGPMAVTWGRETGERKSLYITSSAGPVGSLQDVGEFKVGVLV